jgi:hypothetical protein
MFDTINERKKVMKKVLHSLPSPLTKTVEEGKAAIVGGAVRAYFENNPPRDIDIFFFDRERYETLITKFEVEKKAEGIHTIHNHDPPIDLIFEEECRSVQDCIEQADFDIAAGCYSEGKFFLPDGYEKAIADRKMTLKNLLYPQACFERFMRYKRYGYSCSVKDVKRIIQIWNENTTEEK